MAGVGARTVRALAMVAEVVHGAPYRFADPARFSFAHSGKDRHPFPVPLPVYDETIRVLKSAVRNAKLGRQEDWARSSGLMSRRGCSSDALRVLRSMSRWRKNESGRISMAAGRFSVGHHLQHLHTGTSPAGDVVAQRTAPTPEADLRAAQLTTALGGERTPDEAQSADPSFVCSVPLVPLGFVCERAGIGVAKGEIKGRAEGGLS